MDVTCNYVVNSIRSSVITTEAGGPVVILQICDVGPQILMKELQRFLTCLSFFSQLINCLTTGCVSTNLLIAITQQMFVVKILQAVNC